MDDHTTRCDARSLGLLFKLEATEHEMRWWLEEKSRCNSYFKHTLFLDNEKYMEGKVPPTLKLPKEVVEYM